MSFLVRFDKRVSIIANFFTNLRYRSVIIIKPKNALNLLHIARIFSFLDSLDLFWVHLITILTYYVTKALNFMTKEFTL